MIDEKNKVTIIEQDICWHGVSAGQSCSLCYNEGVSG